MLKKNYILSILTIIFSGFFLIQTYQMDMIGGSFYINDKAWPTFTLIGMFALGIWMLIRTYFQSKKADKVSTAEAEVVQETQYIDSEATVMNVDNDATALNQQKIEEDAEENNELEPRKYFNINMNIISIIVLAIYFFLMSRVGFIISTVLFVSIMSSLLGVKNKWISIGLGLATTIIIIVVFPHLLGIPLPRGMGVFLRFSQIFY